MADDDPTAALQPVKDRAGVFAKLGPPRPEGFDAVSAAAAASAADVPVLVAALEAVLANHQPGRVMILGSLCKRHENHRHFSITRTEADDVRACPDCAASVYTSCTGCNPQVSIDTCPDRLAITRALKGGTDA